MYLLPDQEKGALYGNVRRKIDYWFWHFKLRYPSKKKQDKYLNFFKSYRAVAKEKLIRTFNISKFFLPGYTQKIFHQEAALLETDTNYKTMQSFVTSLKADAVFTVTPYHNAEDLFLRACKSNGLKMLTSILSFDNITKRGWIPVPYDLYMVWNKYNEEELHNIYPFTKTKKVVITGAPQFDFYNKPEWLTNKQEWQKDTGLGNKKYNKIILYGGGPKSLFPQEPAYLKHIDDAISSGEIKGNPTVLFRCHPVDDITRWTTALKNSKNVVFDNSWTGSKKLQLTTVTVADIKKLCSTLAYTDVHINICSTMAVDGSAFNKPQVAPAYFPGSKRGSKLLRNMYLQKHFQPIIKVKGIQQAYSKEELTCLINEALHFKYDNVATALNVMHEIITFNDMNATNRVAEAIKTALSNK